MAWCLIKFVSLSLRNFLIITIKEGIIGGLQTWNLTQMGTGFYQMENVTLFDSLHLHLGKIRKNCQIWQFDSFKTVKLANLTACDSFEKLSNDSFKTVKLWQFFSKNGNWQLQWGLTRKSVTFFPPQNTPRSKFHKEFEKNGKHCRKSNFRRW